MDEADAETTGDAGRWLEWQQHCPAQQAGLLLAGLLWLRRGVLNDDSIMPDLGLQRRMVAQVSKCPALYPTWEPGGPHLTRGFRRNGRA